MNNNSVNIFKKDIPKGKPVSDYDILLYQIELSSKIMQQIYKAVEKLGGDMELLSLIGSYGDTLPASEILELLEDYNNRKP